MNRTNVAAILYYHSVENNPMSVPPAVFRAQLSWLKQRGYRCGSVAEWLASGNKVRQPGKCVALTFDDGFGNMWESVLPLLQEFAFTATFFVVPGYVGRTLWGDAFTKKWSCEEGPARIPFPMMTWAQIARMSEAGMEIASHTLSHRNLTEISEQDARREIQESKETLEQKLGIRIRGFCYPRGRVTDTLARLVQEAGYDYACTTLPGHATVQSDRFLLPRIPGPASVSDLIFRLNRIPRNILTRSALRLARYAETVQRRLSRGA